MKFPFSTARNFIWDTLQYVFRTGSNFLFGRGVTFSFGQQAFSLGRAGTFIWDFRQVFFGTAGRFFLGEQAGFDW